MIAPTTIEKRTLISSEISAHSTGPRKTSPRPCHPLCARSPKGIAKATPEIKTTALTPEKAMRAIHVTTTMSTSVTMTGI